MRRLINYIRQCFCNHEWVIEEHPYRKMDGDVIIKTTSNVYMRCKKCCYHQKHHKS